MTELSAHGQIPLALAPRERFELDLFVAGRNTDLCAHLRALANGERNACIYLWGGSGTGKSHLLQGVCHAANEHGMRCAYLPMSSLNTHGEAVLEGLEHLDLVAFDELEAISGSSVWEQALFNFYNRMYERDGNQLFAATASPRGLGMQLPDLVSRLGWGQVFHLQPLTDADRREAIIRRATARGFELPEEVADYLLRHMSRDIAELMAFLDRMDTAQLASQRRLSIPFVKTLLQDSREAG